MVIGIENYWGPTIELTWRSLVTLSKALFSCNDGSRSQTGVVWGVGSKDVNSNIDNL